MKLLLKVALSQKNWSKNKSAETETKKLSKNAREGSIRLGVLVMNAYYISYVLCSQNQHT